MTRGFPLKDVNNDNEQEEKQEGSCNTKENLPTSQGQAKHSCWKEEEPEHQVSYGKPSVVSSFVAKGLCKTDGYFSQIRDRIPHDDARYVEEQMAEGYLECFVQI